MLPSRRQFTGVHVWAIVELSHTTVTGISSRNRTYVSFARFGVGGASARSALGRYVKDEHVKDVAQDVAEDV